jgi:predicted NAD/FAD-dependent oxidoreductase
MAEKFEIPAMPEGWHFAGDLLTESRVEASWLAGREAARRILSGA